MPYNWATTPEAGSDPYRNLLEALAGVAGGNGPPNPTGADAGINNDMGGLPNLMPSYSGWGGNNDFLTNPNLAPGMSQGPAWEGGDRQPGELTAAENAKWGGRGVGAVTGTSGMGVLANALAQIYMNGTVFSNPLTVSNSSTQSPMDNAIDQYVQGFTPEQSLAPRPAPSRHGAGYGPGRRMMQSGGAGPMAGGIKMRRRPTTGGIAAVNSSGVDKKKPK